MSNEQYDLNNTQVQMILVIKLQQLHREALPILTYRSLEEYLSMKLWKDGCPESLHDAANQVLSIKPEDIVRYFSLKAVREGREKNLSDFKDVIGG